MTCNVPAFAHAVLSEATRIARNRRTSSDGVCGDAAHQAEVSDHNPSGPHNYAHAVDVSQSTPGSPYWDARYDQFDAHAYGYAIAKRMLAGTERRVKYLVSFDGTKDVIFNLAVSREWRQNGSFKTDHANHLHISFTVAAEESVAPFFTPAALQEADMPLNAEDLAKLQPIIEAACAKAIKTQFYAEKDGKKIDALLLDRLRAAYK